MQAFAALLLGMVATSADGATFEGLFAFPGQADHAEAAAPALAPFAPRADQGVCIAAIRQAEKAYDIPRDLLLAIGLQEAGMSYKGSMTIWPWSLNVEGRGVRFDSRAEAETYLAGELTQGTQSIDVGCLQINLRWHPDAFPSPAEGFDPVRNAEYAARFLRELYAETGDWIQAAGHYHSATPSTRISILRVSNDSWQKSGVMVGHWTPWPMLPLCRSRKASFWRRAMPCATKAPGWVVGC